MCRHFSQEEKIVTIITKYIYKSNIHLNKALNSNANYTKLQMSYTLKNNIKQANSAALINWYQQNELNSFIVKYLQPLTQKRSLQMQCYYKLAYWKK